MQHMVLSLSMRAHGGQSVHTLVESDSNICCLYTMYPSEDEHLWLEKCRGI